MSTAFTEVAEVVEVDAAGANALLAAGYQLLAVQSESRWIKAPTPQPLGYVAKATVYVMGRPAGVERVEPPARKREAPPAYVPQQPKPRAEAPPKREPKPPKRERTATPDASAPLARFRR